MASEDSEELVPGFPSIHCLPVCVASSLRAASVCRTMLLEKHPSPFTRPITQPRNSFSLSCWFSAPVTLSLVDTRSDNYE
jgi:hypothetical protein